MLRTFILSHTDRYLSRWVIFFFDLSMVLVCYGLAVLMRFNFNLIDAQRSETFPKVVLVLFFYAIGFFISRSFVGIIRHTSLTDALNIVKGAAFAVLCLIGFSFIENYAPAGKGYFNLPRSVVAIHFLCTIFFLVGSRLLLKYFYETIINSKQAKQTRVLIYGAGTAGLTTRNTFTQDNSRGYTVVGFVDDNPHKQGKALAGVPVHGPEKVFNPRFMGKHRPDQVIISIQKSLPTARKKEIVDMALEYGLQVKIVPPFESWIHGELSPEQIKSVRIEDLLERDPIILDNVNVSREVKGKVVMVTGAAGSIGSEIARQLLHYSPQKVILLDQAESALYDLQVDIKNNNSSSFKDIEILIADVTNRKRMERAFETFRPDVVYHAAAYKHVPLMEDNPYEAISVNVFGTKVVADLSVEYGVSKFVLVSTDKAVNPTNVMGASKRTAEIYTQSLSMLRGTQTQFIITRFGNVLGSNGSVIPLFKKQIARGGPITITDKRITRYFMTIPEACHLVLEAGAMGMGGEIFVFDMGESVKIYDLAKKMIKLSGLQLGRDIEIREIGLRPGEKLYEELLALKENTKETHHPKIMIAQLDGYEFKRVKEGFADLEQSLSKEDNHQLVGCLKKLVPEYISNNSVFASLDFKKIVNE